MKVDQEASRPLGPAERFKYLQHKKKTSRRKKKKNNRFHSVTLEDFNYSSNLETVLIKIHERN